MKCDVREKLWKRLTKAEIIVSGLASRDYAFLKMTDEHVYAIRGNDLCYINDEELVEDFLDANHLLKSPWNHERSQIGRLVQLYISELAKEVTSNEIEWKEVPQDVNTLEWAKFADKLLERIIAQYENDHNEILKGK